MNYKQLLLAVPRLKGWRETAFVLTLAERNLPNFELFAEVAGQGNGLVIRELSDECWKLLVNKEQSPNHVSNLINQLEQLRVVEEDYDMYGVYPASKALELLSHVMYSWVNPENRRALEAAQLSLAVVTEFIEYSSEEGASDDELVSLFKNHPLVKQEQLFQIEAYECIQDARYPSEELLAELRELGKNDGISNIGICLE